MRLIDEIHLAYPFYGSRKIRDELWAGGHYIGRGQVRRLMRKMSIEALYVKPRLSIANICHRKSILTCCAALSLIVPIEYGSPT